MISLSTAASRREEGLSRRDWCRACTECKQYDDYLLSHLLLLRINYLPLTPPRLFPDLESRLPKSPRVKPTALEKAFALSEDASLDPRVRKRNMVLNEIIRTERDYIKDLAVMRDVRCLLGLLWLLSLYLYAHLPPSLDL